MSQKKRRAGCQSVPDRRSQRFFDASATTIVKAIVFQGRNNVSRWMHRQHNSHIRQHPSKLRAGSVAEFWCENGNLSRVMTGTLTISSDLEDTRRSATRSAGGIRRTRSKVFGLAYSWDGKQLQGFIGYQCHYNLASSNALRHSFRLWPQRLDARTSLKTFGRVLRRYSSAPPRRYPIPRYIR